MTDGPISLLIVEDDADFRDSSARWMERKGHDVSAAASGAEALSLCDRQHFDVGIFDMNMPGMSGIELLQRIHQDEIDMEVIILTGQGTIESAVQAMKLGASDYLTKPCPLGDLEHHCQLAKERGRLRRENERLKTILSRSQQPSEIVGDSPAMAEVNKLIRRIAPTDKPVLISGESGTGKEVVAKAIQQASQVASMPFVTVNCAALPDQLVESELFGHQKGSFTGATSEKPGLFEVADGGTLFIDELGELPLALQPKLLRVLEDGSMRRIGSHKERHVNVRIIAATNRDLGDAVQEGKFREDLYYRVNVLPIKLPALRDRPGDIDLLLDHFIPPEWHVDAESRKGAEPISLAGKCPRTDQCGSTSHHSGRWQRDYPGRSPARDCADGSWTARRRRLARRGRHPASRAQRRPSGLPRRRRQSSCVGRSAEAQREQGASRSGARNSSPQIVSLARAFQRGIPALRTRRLSASGSRLECPLVAHLQLGFGDSNSANGITKGCHEHAWGRLYQLRRPLCIPHTQGVPNPNPFRDEDGRLRATTYGR